MLAKLTATKQLTLPDELLVSVPGVDCFSASVEDRRIVLVPLRPSRADAVREKLAELGISEEDVKDAVAWVRRQDCIHPRMLDTKAVISDGSSTPPNPPVLRAWRAPDLRCRRMCDGLHGDAARHMWSTYRAYVSATPLLRAARVHPF